MRSRRIKILAVLLFGISCAAALAIELELKFGVEHPIPDFDGLVTAAAVIRRWQAVQLSSALLSLILVFIALYRRSGRDDDAGTGLTSGPTNPA